MNDLGPDDKVCPFCGEVIKAAAIKCPSCHSDLPVSEVPPREVVATAVASAATGVPSGLGAGSGGAPAARRGPDRVVAALLVLSAVLAGALVALVLVARPDALATADGQVTLPSYRVTALRAATTTMTALLSYDYRTLDQDEKTARAGLSAKVASDYDKEMATLGPKAVAAMRVVQAQVKTAGIVSLKKERARVLVFVDLTVTERSAAPMAVRKRILVSLTRAHGAWVVSKTEDVLIN